MPYTQTHQLSVSRKRAWEDLDYEATCKLTFSQSKNQGKLTLAKGSTVLIHTPSSPTPRLESFSVSKLQNGGKEDHLLTVTLMRKMQAVATGGGGAKIQSSKLIIKDHPPPPPNRTPLRPSLPTTPSGTCPLLSPGMGWEKEAYATDIPSIPEPPCQRSLNRLPHSAQGQGASIGQVSFRGAMGTAAEDPQRQS